jgi:hypothetical protein
MLMVHFLDWSPFYLPQNFSSIRATALRPAAPSAPSTASPLRCCRQTVNSRRQTQTWYSHHPGSML